MEDEIITSFFASIIPVSDEIKGSLRSYNIFTVLNNVFSRKMYSMMPFIINTISANGKIHMGIYGNGWYDYIEISINGGWAIPFVGIDPDYLPKLAEELKLKCTSKNFNLEVSIK